MNDAVIGLIERELSGKNLLYFESSSRHLGSFDHRHLQAGHQSGTGPGRCAEPPKAVESRLPQAVRQNGLSVESSSSSFLMIVGINSTRKHDEQELGDYLARNVVDELRRVPGVGRVQLFGAERAMRVWVDPVKLIAYGCPWAM
jgi:multidrug efflux pump